jgi:Tfp pilus assembly protein PilX
MSHRDDCDPPCGVVKDFMDRIEARLGRQGRITMWAVGIAITVIVGLATVAGARVSGIEQTLHAHEGDRVLHRTQTEMQQAELRETEWRDNVQRQLDAIRAGQEEIRRDIRRGRGK